MDTPTPAAAVQWIVCNAWELDLYGLPHRIPWPGDSDPKLAEQSPFDAGLLLNAIEDLGEAASPPWTDFLKASEHFDNLAEALEDNEFPKARELLDEIDRVHPGTIFTKFHRAHVLRHDGQVDEAIDLYREVAQQVPRFGFVWVNLGSTLAAEGRRDEAVMAFQNALRVVPNDAAALDGLAAMRAAVRIQRDPNDPKSVGYLDIPSFARMATEQIEHIAENPDQLQPFAEQLLRDGFAPDAAAKALQKLLEIRPGDARALLGLAAAYRQMGQHDEARKAVIQFTEMHPKEAGGWLHLAQTCNAAGDTAGEAAALDKVLEVDPNVQAAIGLKFRVAENPTSSDIEVKVVEFGEQREAWMPMLIASAIARDRGDLVGALRHADRAREINPEVEEPILHLCAILGQVKETVRLVAEIDPLIASGKYSPRLNWNYAQALKSAGRQQEAIAALVAAASIEGAPDEFKQAAASTIDFWEGHLTESGTTVEVLKAGVIARPILLRLDDGDGAVLLQAGRPLPLEGKFPWRVPPDGRAETRIRIQQGQTGSAVEPRDLGCFIVRGLPPVVSGAHTLQCQIAATPQAKVVFRAELGNRILRVAWEPPLA